MRRSQSLRQPIRCHATSALSIIVGSAYLSPDLASVFSKVRKHIKGSERRSRTEAFLEWAEENPDEIYAMQEQRAAREIERLVKEYQRETRRTAGDRESF